MITLYRKYRSKNFDEVIGQDPIVKTLTNQIKLGRVGHAYLFTGSRGVGKTSCARIFARAVNCLNPVNGNPCGKCAACKALSSANCVDLIEIDAASNSGVDDVRELREKVKFAPAECKYKVYIIDEVHMLSTAAFNALLKTLEEPPEHVIFILATTEPQKLLPTIQSRCLRFDFKLVPMELLSKHIQKIYDAEGIKYEVAAADEIARKAEGSVRDALSIADTVATAADVVTAEVVASFTGSSDIDTTAKLFDMICNKDLAGCFEVVDELIQSGKSALATLNDLENYARNVMVIKAVGEEKAENSGLINVAKRSFDRLFSSCKICDANKAADILSTFSLAEGDVRDASSGRLCLENALITATTTISLSQRVAALEKQLSALSADQKKNIIENVRQTKAAQPEIVNAVPPDNSVYDIPPSPTKNDIPQISDDYEPPQEPPSYDVNENKQTLNSPITDKPVKFTRAQLFNLSSSDGAPKIADEGEFMHGGAARLTGLELFGKLASYLRKQGDDDSARIKELLSRDVILRERSDAVSLVADGQTFLLLSESSTLEALQNALTNIGVNKRITVERTDENRKMEALEKLKDVFGVDCVEVPRAEKKAAPNPLAPMDVKSYDEGDLRLKVVSGDEKGACNIVNFAGKYGLSDETSLLVGRDGEAAKKDGANDTTKEDAPTKKNSKRMSE